MKKSVVVEAELREISNKQGLKSARIQGKIPGIFYGHNEPATAINIDGKIFDKLVHSGLTRNMLVDLKVGGNSKICIIKEVQRNLLTRSPIHIDFQAISMTEKIEVTIPVHTAGVAPGVKSSGGILEHVIRELHVKCLPSDMPEEIIVDVSQLQIGDGIHIKDLTIPKGVEVHDDPESIVINVVSPTKLEEPVVAAVEGAVAAAPSAAEPEVISKGKKDLAEEAAPAK